MHGPSFNQNRILFACYLGTLRPSQRHGRSIRLSFNCHPASLSILRSGDNRNARTTGPFWSCLGPDDPHRLGTLEHNGTSSDTASRPGKRGVRKHQTDAAPGRYSRAALRSAGVSLRDILRMSRSSVKAENSPAKSLILLFHPLLLLELIHPHAAVLLASTITRLFRNRNLADSVIFWLTLPNKYLNLLQSRGELFLYVLLCCQSFSSAR